MHTALNYKIVRYLCVNHEVISFLSYAKIVQY